MRSANVSGLRNFDEDSDIDEIEQEVRRPAVRKGQSGTRLRVGGNASDDNSHDENRKFNRQQGNSQNVEEELDRTSTKAQVRVSNMRRIVSKPSGGNGSGESSGFKGFVPRDLSSKAKRTAQSSQPTSNPPLRNRQAADDADEEEGQNAPAPWTSVPKTFLGEPEAPTAFRNDQSRIPSFVPANKPVRSQAAAVPKATYRPSQPTAKPGELPPKAWQHRVEGMDSDEEDASAHTDESGDEQQRRQQADDSWDDAAYTQQQLHRQQQHQAQQPRSAQQQAQQALRKLQQQQQQDDECDYEIEQDDPDVIQDGQFYEDYRARSLEAASADSSTRPNKSGRYAESEGGALSGGWVAPVVGKRPGPSSLWAAVQPPPSLGPSSGDFGPSSRFSFVMVAHARGLRTEHVQCTVVRDRRASINGKLHPTYELILEETNKAIIIAQKMNMNRTSNYHLFDLTRPHLSKKFSKKSGNYLGKLRAKNINRTEYVLLNQNSEREEIAGVRFDRISLMNQIKDGNQPRKMKVVIPPNNEFGVPIPNRTAETDAGSLAEKLTEYESTALGRGADDLYVYESKDPVLENGNFRLNFHGRVSKPSVKNFQMVSREDTDDIICQFGKVDEDVFHLDFKAPVTPVQAFAFALAQFNL